MNRKHVLGVLGVVVAVLGVWWWTHRDREPAEPTSPEPGRGSAAAIVRPTKPDTRPSTFARMIDDDPRGRLQLEGQVIDGDDKPVKGATVVLSANPPRSATTEDDGSFTFEALVGRPYTLIARAPGGIAGPVTARLTAKSEPIIMRLRPGAKLTVATTCGGTPCEANVELRGFDEQRVVTQNGRAVFANVAPGGYQVAAWAERKARTYAWVQVGSGDSETKLALPSGAPVSGRVVDDRGTPVGGARVRASGASDWSQQGRDRSDAAVSAADGTFTLEGLPAGTFRFVAAHPKYAPGTSALVTVDGQLPHDGVTIALATGARVRGKVVDQAGNGVAAARVRIGAAPANPRAMIWDPPRQAYTDDAGAFEVEGLPKKPLSAVALHESGASDVIAVDASNGDVDNVKLAIDRTGTIAGIVVDPAGQPLEGVQVRAGPSFADNRTQVDFSQWRLRGFPEELTDSSGRFTLTGLAPGTYQLSAASISRRGRRGPGVGDGVAAKTGDSNVKLVLPPEGAVRGKVAFADGSAPALFTVAIGMIGEPYASGGEFVLDGLAPQKYELQVRGPTFQTRAMEIVIESGKTLDVGTITVVKGRTIGGIVVADGKPVSGAQVHVGRTVLGNGTSSNAQFGPMGGATKHDTTDASGAFVLSGFGDGDITIVAEHETIGRSRALRLPTTMPGQTELVLALEKFGSLTGVLRQGGKPIEGVFVACQSVTTPGAVYSVASGPDGTYRFDRLAPDTYKVSATVGMPMVGMKFYSKQIEVPSGKAVTIDLVVEPGTITVDVTVTARNGKVGVANAYLVSAPISAKTATELSLKIAAMGPGASHWVIVRNGEPARFTEVVPNTYSLCVVAFPAEVRGMAAMTYTERHGDSLLAVCKPVAVAAAPDAQAVTIQVDLPPFVPDSPPGGGSGSAGSGSGG